MRVLAVMELVDEFVTALKSGTYELDYGVFYGSLEQWQKHFVMDEDHLHDAFSRSLSSPAANRLWGGNHHSLKSAMLDIISHDPMYAALAFRDFFNETNDLSLRLGRFMHFIEDTHQRLNKGTTAVLDHHQDYYALSLYLSHQYPEKYLLFDHTSFVTLLTRCDARNIPGDYDLVRYFTLCKTIYTLACKNEELCSIYRKRVQTSDQTIYMIMVNDLMNFVHS